MVRLRIASTSGRRRELAFANLRQVFCRRFKQGATAPICLIVTTSQITNAVHDTAQTWGSITEIVWADGPVATAMPDCNWEWKFSSIVDSVCADYKDLPSFMSLRWD